MIKQWSGCKPMLLRSTPGVEEKLEVLGEGARYDLACGTCGEGRVRQNDVDQWIYPSVLPNGRTQWMLKVLMSNTCLHNCRYCAFRHDRDIRRVSLSPEELASLFADLLRRRKVSALFLSSAVCHKPVQVMDDMLKAAHLVRVGLNFRGYLHLKLIPGIEDDQVDQALRLADRVSANLETVDQEHLSLIAPQKRHEEGLFRLLEVARQLMDTNPRAYRCRGITTQYVVGAAGEKDEQFIKVMGRTRGALGVKRNYFSAHNPIAETPLESLPPTPLWRENRLYQADFLLQDYGFKEDEFVFDNKGNFEFSRDPKKAWADSHPEIFPLEINNADPEQLLRVPGLGPKGVERILATRQETPFTELEHLRNLHVSMKKAAPYLLFKGRRRLAGGGIGQEAFPF